MKQLITLTVLLAIGVLTYGQTITFIKSYDNGFNDADECHTMKQTTDGGYIMAGATWASDDGWYDMVIHKVNSLGESQWIKTYGVGSMNIEVSFGIITTQDGGYMMVGGTDGFSADDETDMWVIKTDASGDSLWSKHYGGDKSEYAHGGIQTSNNGYVFVGATNSEGAGFDDIYVVRTDENGNVVWAKDFGTNKMDGAYGVEETSDGGFVIAGEIENGDYGYIIKVDADGEKVWDYTCEPDDYMTSNFFDITVANDGGIVATGRVQATGGGGQNVLLVKLNADGIEVWRKNYGGDKKDVGRSVVETTDNGFFITGYTESFTQDEEDSDVYLIKTDADGEIVWTKNYGTIKDEGGYEGVQTTDGGYAAGGYTYVQGESSNFYLLKLDSDGLAGDDTEAPTVPQNLVAESKSETEIRLTWDYSTDNVAVAGYKIYRDGTNIGSIIYSSYTDTALTTGTEYTYTVSAYDAAGNESDQSTSASATPCVGVDNQTAGQLNIYPNPVTNTATVEFFNPNNKNYVLNITNLNGQVVKTITNITDNKVTIEKGNLQSGIYFIELKGNKYQYGRIVIK